jgi:hypothetical protein
MKTPAIAAALLWMTAVVLSDAHPMHAGIDYQRYLAEKDDVAAELEQWRAKYAEDAAANGWIPATEERSADDAEEDQRQRFFLTKQRIAEVQELNPDANFSTDSPFTLMTDDEFTTYVANSYVQSNSTRAARSRKLRRQADLTTDTASWYEEVKALVETALTQFSAGTVMPASEADDGSGTIVYTDGSGSTATDSYSLSHGTPGWWWWPSTPEPSTPEPSTPTPTTPAPTTSAPVATTSTPVATTAAPPASVTEVTASDSDSVDWSASSCMPPIQNQGQCGSCWAFATVAAIESGQCISGGQTSLTKYSEQQLVGCDSQNWGCNGGAPEYAYEYVQSNGLCLEDDYPYTSSDGYSGSCSSSGCEAKDTGLSGYSYLRGEDELLSALNERPVVVAVSSGNSVWKQYTGGVVSSCDSWQLDHAVVAVGYDASTIKIRNSWGTYWGEEGYIRLSRSSDDSGTCGVLSDMNSLEI